LSSYYINVSAGDYLVNNGFNGFIVGVYCEGTAGVTVGAGCQQAFDLFFRVENLQEGAGCV
jgi:hypothetical protein